MTYLHTVILSVVEGITEFLPISSTFHLIYVGKFLGIQSLEFVRVFEVVIQSGAALAIFFVFKRSLWFSKRLYIKLFISTVPALIAGFFLHSFIKTYLFAGSQFSVVVFMLVGGLFIVSELWMRKREWRLYKGILDVSFLHAFVVGFMQCLALVPGVSRSGAVLLSMLGLGYKRDDAATYALALSLPTLFAASVFDVYRSREALMISLSENTLLLIIGFILSFITAYYAARWLVAYLKNHTLLAFGIYRILLGILLLGFGRL